MQIQKMCEIIWRLSNAWSFADSNGTQTQMEHFKEHFKNVESIWEFLCTNLDAIKFDYNNHLDSIAWWPIWPSFMFFYSKFSVIKVIGKLGPRKVVPRTVWPRTVGPWTFGPWGTSVRDPNLPLSRGRRLGPGQLGPIFRGPICVEPNFHLLIMPNGKFSVLIKKWILTYQW